MIHLTVDRDCHTLTGTQERMGDMEAILKSRVTCTGLLHSSTKDDKISLFRYVRGHVHYD